MAVEILRARGVDRDLALLFDALAASYRALGDTTAEALARAGARVRSVEATMAGLGRTAFLARPRPDLLPDLREVVADRAVYTFLVDREPRRIRILAVSFVGADPALRDRAR
jgi:plasmid stabilization system protein ParE